MANTAAGQDGNDPNAPPRADLRNMPRRPAPQHRPIPGYVRFAPIVWMVANVVADLLAIAAHTTGIPFPWVKLALYEAALGTSVYSDWRIIQGYREYQNDVRSAELKLFLLVLAGLLGALLMAAALAPPEMLNMNTGGNIINIGLWTVLALDLGGSVWLLTTRAPVQDE